MPRSARITDVSRRSWGLLSRLLRQEFCRLQTADCRLQQGHGEGEWVHKCSGEWGDMSFTCCRDASRLEGIWRGC